MLTEFKLDTGSYINLIPNNLFNEICKNSECKIDLDPVNVKLEAYNALFYHSRPCDHDIQIDVTSSTFVF